MAKYQLLPPLSAEEHAALERSIIEHGVLVPVEYDEPARLSTGITASRSAKASASPNGRDSCARG